jgi:DNA-binding MarR family transcriptional regulator
MKNLETLGLLLRTLNPNDIKIIVYCDHSPLSVGELTNLVGIAQNNLIKRLKHLEDIGKIKIKRGEKGKKTFVSISPNIDLLYLNSCHVLFTLIMASEDKDTKKTISLKESDSKRIFEVMGGSDSNDPKVRQYFKNLTSKFLKEHSK